MKKYLVLFLSLLLFISGCMNPPSKITGPKWTSKFTLPLVIREKKQDGTTNSEFRLDGVPNGKNETGPDLTGDGSAAYAPGGAINLSGGTFGCIETNSVSQAIPLPTSGTVIVNDETTIGNTAIFAAMDDYFGFRTSNATIRGAETINNLHITISNGSAGAGGLAIQVTDTESDIRQAIINQGSNSANIYLTNFELTNGVGITFTGTCDIGAGGGSITITLSKLQVSNMTIKGHTLDSFPNKTIIVNEEYQFDMSELVDSSIYISNCSLTFSISNMPDNLSLGAYFILEAYDSGNHLLYSESHTTPNPPLAFQNSSQTITLPFNSNYSYLKFKLERIGLEAVDEGRNIIIDGNQAINFTVRPHLTLQSQVQEMEATKVEQSVIQSVSLNLSVINNTRLGLGVKLYLSPLPNPMTDANAVVFNFTVNPAAIPGQALETRHTSLSLTAAQISYLTGSQMIYNQFEIVDLSTGKVQVNPYPFLEIRSSATLEVLINKED